MTSMNNNNERKKYYTERIPQEERTDANSEAKNLGQNLLKQFEEGKAEGNTVGDILMGDTFTEQLKELETYNSSTENTTQLRMFGSIQHNTAMIAFVDKKGNVADEIVSSDTPPEIENRADYYNNMEPLSKQTLDNNDSPKDSAMADSPGEYASPPEGVNSQGLGFVMDEESSDNSESVGGSDSDRDFSDDNGPGSDLEKASDEDSKDNLSTKDIKKVPTSEEAEQSTSSGKRKRDDDDSDEDKGGPSKRIDLEDYLMDPGSDLFDLAGE